jgi:hypothetical protein
MKANSNPAQYCCNCPCQVFKDSRKNKFTFSGVEASVRQGAKAQAYQDMSSFRNAAGRDASAHKNMNLFLREPKGRGFTENRAPRLRISD